ncbi:MAG: 50S ribosomal protein L13 [Deltaproteobacteria bacterium]|uniref:Large ribosomal subunit protein uL13 n=1 Tax=Candidatus Zymogenus saltonus TaxID=2844893 RepID=A0A9D8KIW7_9DELT|nr:50S ribosomal protein L13 [Candidatus Zymogenus saltonus]
MKTVSAKSGDFTQDWFLVDANEKILGRLASEVASVLRGKKKPIFTPHVDTGDFVVVVNAEKIRLTGNKLKDKKYYSHTGYPGGIKEITAEKLLAKKPEELVIKAVRGMLPKNRLGRKMIKKLKVYAGPEHPHHAQSPKTLNLK